MKTITEFSGFVLAEGLKLRKKLADVKITELEVAARDAANAKKAEEAKQDPVVKNEATAELAANAVKPTAEIETEASTESPAEAKTEAPTVMATGSKAETLEQASEAEVTTHKKTDSASAEAKSVEEKKTATKDERPAKKKRHRHRSKSKGKHRDSRPKIDWKKVDEEIRPELSQAVGDAFKLEGEKLEYFLNALSVVDHRKVVDLKRVVVLQLDKDEKAPAELRQRGEQHFRAEYRPPLAPPKGKGKGKWRGRVQGKGKGRFGKGRGKGKGRGRGRPGAGGGGRGDRDRRPRRFGDRGKPKGGAKPAASTASA